MTGFSCRWSGAAKSEHRIQVYLDDVAARVQGPGRILRNKDFKDFLNTALLFSDDEERGCSRSLWAFLSKGLVRRPRVTTCTACTGAETLATKI